MKATSLLAVGATLFFTGLACGQATVAPSGPPLVIAPTPVAFPVVNPPAVVPAENPPAVAPPQGRPVVGPATPPAVAPSANPPVIVAPAPSRSTAIAPVTLPPRDFPADDTLPLGPVHEVCEECNCSPARFWLSADVLFWWIRPGPVAIPLATTGPFGNPRAGFLDEPSTQVLIGDRPIHYGTFTGLRLDGGWWFNEERTLGLDINGFVLEQRVRGVVVASDDQAGNPVLTRSIINTSPGPPGKGNGKAKGITSQESVYAISYPDGLVGLFAASSASRLGGAELNLVGLIVNTPQLSVDLIGGFRYLSLNEDLFMTHDSTSLADNQLFFLGDKQPSGSEVIVDDFFWTHNHFYGGQVGAKVNWSSGRFNVGVVGKLALGATQQVIRADGETTLITPDGAVVSTPGGALATSSNSGRQDSWHVTMVPELDLNLGWQLSPQIRLNLGYSFLYWSTVQRPGNVLDRTVDGGRVPSDPLFGTSDQNHPTIIPRRTAFWAQGINFGLEFRF